MSYERLSDPQHHGGCVWIGFGAVVMWWRLKKKNSACSFSFHVGLPQWKNTMGSSHQPGRWAHPSQHASSVLDVWYVREVVPWLDHSVSACQRIPDLFRTMTTASSCHAPADI